MARLQLSGLVSNITGSIGGTTFQHYHNIQIAKTKRASRRTRTPRQQSFMNASSYVTRGWQDLNLTNRAAWNNYATSLNRTKGKEFPKRMSGFNLFVIANSYFLLLGAPGLAAPALVIGNSLPLYVILIEQTGTLIVQFDRALVTADERAILFLTAPVKASLTNPSGRLRLIKSVQTDSDTLDVTDEYISLFGQLPQPDDNIFFTLATISLSSGWIFPKYTDRWIVTG